MARLPDTYPETPVPGAEALGKYPAGGTDDERLEWILRYGLAAEGLPDFPDGERLELEYYRVSHDAMLDESAALMEENAMLRRRIERENPDTVAALVIEKLTEHVEAHAKRVWEAVSRNVNRDHVVPHAESVIAATKRLGALEATQRDLEARLRVVVGEVGATMRVTAWERGQSISREQYRAAVVEWNRAHSVFPESENS